MGAAFIAYAIALTLRIELICTKIDPINVPECTEYITECAMDEGKEQEQWCIEDYKEFLDYKESYYE